MTKEEIAFLKEKMDAKVGAADESSENRISSELDSLIYLRAKVFCAFWNFCLFAPCDFLFFPSLFRNLASSLLVMMSLLQIV